MFIISRISRHLFLGLSVLIISASISFANPKPGGDLVVPVDGFPPHFNSAIKTGFSIYTAASQIFVSLVQINMDYKPVPYLAKSWEISPDGLTYTFHLHEGTEFHDGKPVTSKDVAFSLGLSKANHPMGKSMFALVDRVETPDKYTAVIKLKKSHPALMTALAAPLLPILPEHVYGEANGPIRKNPANIKAIGSGPFKVKEFTAGKSYILERNENFFRQGRPYLDRYIARKVSSPSSALIALSNQEIHTHREGDPQFVAKMKENKLLRVSSEGMRGIGSTNFIEFNLRKKYVKDKRVRHAIAYAIDREFITKTLHRGNTRTSTGPIPYGHPFYTDDVSHFRVNLEKANQILDDAGYKRGSDGTRFELKLIYPPFTGYSQKMVAEYMKPQLKKIGIKINLKPPADFQDWYTTLSAWDHDMSTSNVFMWGDPVIGTYRLFMSDNIKHRVWTNTAGYINKEVDAILIEASSETDQAKRRALYVKFQQIISDELPYYFIVEDVFYEAYHKDLVNTPSDTFSGGPWDAAYWKDGKAP